MSDPNNQRILRASPLASELSDEECARLADILSVRSLADGELLIEEGKVDHSLHGVIKGALAVGKMAGGGDWVTLHLLHEGDIAGELGFIDGLSHSASLRAVGDTEVFTIERERFDALLLAEPALIYKVMRAIVRVVHAILRRMNVQHIELTNYITKQHGRY
jgi:CRP/FNR family transcriptional regulator, cyclic AMP receptor protein